MALSLTTTVRNNMLDQITSAISTSGLLRIYDGTAPANVGTALSGNTLLAEGTLPADWMAPSASGVKAKTGTWTLTGQTGAGAGTAGTFYRLYDSGGSTCHEQGTFTATGGGGDMTVDNNSIADGQLVTIATYQKTAGNLG